MLPSYSLQPDNTTAIRKRERESVKAHPLVKAKKNALIVVSPPCPRYTLQRQRMTAPQNTAEDRGRALADTAATSAKAAFTQFNNQLTPAERSAFFAFGPATGSWILWLLFALGLVLTPIPVLGAILGYKRAYNRILYPRNTPPLLSPLDPAGRFGLVVGFFVGGLLGFLALFVIVTVVPFLLGLVMDSRSLQRNPSLLLLFVIPSGVLVFWFRNWLRRERIEAAEAGRYGSARFTNERETAPFTSNKALSGTGFFMGWEGDRTLFYNGPGHFLLTAGTRSGKGVSSIIPNLLLDSLQSSWVVIDPKGENAAVAASALRDRKKNVILLNPWQLLQDEFVARGFEGNHSFNPLSLLESSTELNLVDDVDILAEMIVPIPPGGIDKDHFTSRARSFVAGMMLHLVSSPEHADKRNLQTLWLWLRSSTEDLDALILEMIDNEHPTAGPVVSAAAESMGALKVGSSKEFTSIMSSAQRYTDFLKSPALSASMGNSSFDLSQLSAGNTVVFVIIPTDRLKTASQWLRLVVTSLMRSVVRRPDKRVTFVLDEAYALGYVSEIETALGTYAGFGVSLFSIFQTLTQIRELYGMNWENFLGSAAVRQFFGVGDQFTAEYLSQFIGQRTITDFNGFGQLKGVGSRALLNPDEVRRGSKDYTFTFIEQMYMAPLLKIPYYRSETLSKLADPNPYFKG